MGDEEEGSLLAPSPPPPSEDAALSWGEKVVVLGLVTSVSFSSNITNSLVLPFLPQEINALGLPGQFLTGVVFAVFPLAVLVLSPLCNALARRLGRVPLLYAGVPLQAVCALMFGLATRLTISPKGVVFVFLASRSLQGFGAALANLAIFAIVAEVFPASLGKVMGLNEVIIGLGIMLGPVIGSALYSYGGFALPFLAGSGVLWLSFPFVVAYHRQSVREGRGSGSRGGLQAGRRRESSLGSETAFYSAESSPAGRDEEELLSMASPGGTAEEKENEGEAGSFWAQVGSVMTWRLILSAFVLFFAIGAFVWVETILSLHLQNDLGFKEKYIGVVFAVINVTYSVVGPFVGALADKFGYKPIMVAGLMLTGITFIMMGPVSDIIIRREGGLRGQRIFEVSLLGLFGAFQTLCMIPTLPAMKESVPGKLSENQVNTVVMVFNQFQQSGLMFTAPLSGALCPAIGWAKTMGIYGAICLGIGMASSFFFYVYGPVPKDDEEMSRRHGITAPLLDRREVERGMG